MCCDFCTGEVLRVSPFEVYCCCCGNQANWCTNYCGLCGVKSGEPVVLLPFLSALETGESKRTADAFNTARQQWSARTRIA